MFRVVVFVVLAVHVGVGTITMLPDELLTEVMVRIPDSAALVNLSLASHSLHRLAQPLLTERFEFRRRLRNAAAVDTDLLAIIPGLLRSIARARNLHSYAVALKHQDALGLYDHLVRSPLPRSLVIDLLKQLIAAVPVFADIVSFTDFREANAADLLAVMPPRALRDAAVGGVPAPVLETITQLVDGMCQDPVPGVTPSLIAQVRARYPPPFNLCFPYNDKIVFLATWCMKLGECRLLADADAVLALLQNGLRFDLYVYVTRVPVSLQTLRRVWPLLRIPEPKASEFWKILSTLIMVGQFANAVAFLQMPPVVQAIRSDPSGFVQALRTVIAWDRAGLMRFVVRQPFWPDVKNVGGSDDGRTVLDHAIAESRSEIIRILAEGQQRPNPPSPDRQINQSSQPSSSLVWTIMGRVLCGANSA